MTRIEQFAAAALTGIISNRKAVGTDVKSQIKIAWDYAQKMEDEARLHDDEKTETERAAPLEAQEPVNDTNGH